MAFTLNIHFLGLCMFVPDQPASGSTFVLMPVAGANITPHVAMLAVDLAYLQPGSAEPTGQYTLLSLQSAELSLQGLGTPSVTSPPLPVEIANVGEVVKEPIVPAVLGADPSSYLNARIVLDSGTCAPEQVECWIYPPGTPNQQLAQGARWTIPEVNADQLALSPASFGTAAAPLIPTLYPIVQTTIGQPSVATVDLVVCNTSVFELPVMPASVQLGQSGTPGSHFSSYYALFATAPNPGDPAACTNGGGGGGNRYGELPYTCMGPAQSVATPR